MTLEIAADRLVGFGGCNRYTATYTLADSRLSVGPVHPPARLHGAPDAIERAWHEALQAPLQWTMPATR